ncbi:MAG: hypothetical protein R3Y43_04630 [Alphaproteobacteria bacterium]
MKFNLAIILTILLVSNVQANESGGNVGRATFNLNSNKKISDCRANGYNINASECDADEIPIGRCSKYPSLVKECIPQEDFKYDTTTCAAPDGKNLSLSELLGGYEWRGKYTECHGEALMYVQ